MNRGSPQYLYHYLYLPTLTESINSSQIDIACVCDEIKELLLSKNLKYGDAALSPIRFFSKADSEEQLNVRIDDKLNRILNRTNSEDEDVELDLIGYLVLKRVLRKRKEG